MPRKNMASFFPPSHFTSLSDWMVISASNPWLVTLFVEGISSSCEVLWLEFYLKDKCMFPVSSYFSDFTAPVGCFTYLHLSREILLFLSFNACIVTFESFCFIEKLYPDLSEVLFVVRGRNCMGNGYMAFILILMCKANC